MLTNLICMGASLVVIGLWRVTPRPVCTPTAADSHRLRGSWTAGSVDTDFDAMYAVTNAAATAYADVIPADRYHVPYMPAEELRGEIAAGVRFWG